MSRGIEFASFISMKIEFAILSSRLIVMWLNRYVVVLFESMLYVLVNNFSVVPERFAVSLVWTSTTQRIKCLTQRHNHFNVTLKLRRIATSCGVSVWSCDVLNYPQHFLIENELIQRIYAPPAHIILPATAGSQYMSYHHDHEVSLKMSRLKTEKETKYISELYPMRIHDISTSKISKL